MTLRLLVEDLLKNTSNAAALDITKAFDKVKRSKLFISIQKAGKPIICLKISRELGVAIRWNTTISTCFDVKSGNHHGLVLSSSFFNGFVVVFL